MPHRCVRCGQIYGDGSEEILKGCSCGARLFFYVKKEALEKSRQIIEKLTDVEKKQIEDDVREIVGTDLGTVMPSDSLDEDRPVILDLESINISGPGKFELDLSHLFNKKKPLVYKLQEGKYVIDIAQSFLRGKQADDEE